MNHLHSQLIYIFGNDYEFLPENMMPTKFLKFMYEDFDNVTFTAQDENLQILIELLSDQLEKIIEVYGNKFIFSKPMLHFQPQFGFHGPRIGIKIGMMEKEDYESRIKNKNASP